MAHTSLDAFTGLSEEFLKPLGISPSRARLIAAVARSGPITAADLMAQLGIGRSSLAEHIAALEPSGILHSVPDPERQGTTGGGFNRLVYTVDRDALKRHLDRVERSLLGTD